MSTEKVLSHKFGVTGYVELYKKIVKKCSEFDKLYWLKEHAVLMYMWAFRTDNIIKYESSRILTKMCPTKEINKKYYETVFKRYPAMLDERRFYRDNEIIQFLLDMSSALTFLHAHNISHRDIKPSNIAISESGRAVLLDFSHAYRMIIPLDKIDPHVVTYYYRAPEVFKYMRDVGGPPYDSSIDIYSLGMVLIEVLTGDAFAKYYTKTYKTHERAENAYDLFLRNPEGSFSAIKEYFHTAKRGFIYIRQYWTWIAKMIANDPKDRITAEALYLSIKAFADKTLIGYIEPINGKIAAVMDKLDSDIPVPADINSPNEILKSKCIQYLGEIRQKYKISVDSLRTEEVFQFMIGDRYITEDNYKTITAALVIVLETVVFDNVADIEDYEELNREDVKNGIIHIIRRYDQHLFGKNAIFTYNRPQKNL